MIKKRIIKIFNNIKNKIILFLKNTPKKKLILYFGIFLLFIPLSIGTFTLSRYVSKNVYNNFLLSKKFFFYSDSLNGENHVLNDWDGNHPYSIIIDVRNYLDELRWTNTAINYEVEISCDPNISGEISCLANDGTLNYNASGGTTNQINIAITNPNNLEFSSGDYVDMNVSITSTTPYRKTLSSTFRLNINIQDIEYSINDSENSEYVDVIISNFSSESTPTSVLIGWNYELVSIDRTNSYVLNGTKRTTTVNGNAYVNGYYISVPSKVSTTIRFYKKDRTQNYTNNTEVITVIKQIS